MSTALVSCITASIITAVWLGFALKRLFEYYVEKGSWFCTQTPSYPFEIVPDLFFVVVQSLVLWFIVLILTAMLIKQTLAFVGIVAASFVIGLFIYSAKRARNKQIFIDRLAHDERQREE